MRQCFIFRINSDDQGTQGYLITGSDFQCKTIELPWRENKSNISCIPAGDYVVKLRKSNKYGIVFHLKDVTGRTYILIHAGNWAGDVLKEYKSHSCGCILLGLKSGFLGGQKAVLNSKLAIKRFMEHMGDEPFKMKIVNCY